MENNMELPDVANILTALGGLAGGVFGGMKIGKSQQVEEIKELITQYKDANEFTKNEIQEVKEALSETKAMHRECEEGRNQLACRITDLEELCKRTLN